MTISIILLTFNEEENIRQCFHGLRWCDDVWVVDSYSTDLTTTIATEFGAHVVQRKWLGFAEQRNAALSELPLRHDWVLHLDADEFVTSELADELMEIARDSTTSGRDECTAFEVPFRIFFRGRWLRHGGTYPNYQVRFGKKDVLRFVQVGHGQREQLANGRLGRIRHCLYHFGFSKGIGSWITKHVGYAQNEASELQHIQRTPLFYRGTNRTTRLRRLLKHSSRNLSLRPLLRFCYMYILRGGFLDGSAGFHYCFLLGVYEYFGVLLQREIDKGKDIFDPSRVT